MVVSGAACGSRVPDGGFRLDVTDLAKVSIESRVAPLANILQELRAKHGIEVRLNQEVNPPVTVSISGVPLDDALAQIVPPGTHYIVRTGSREWAAGGAKTGAKAGSVAVVDAGAVAKGTARPPVAAAVVKRSSDAAVVPTVQTGPGSKGNPDASLEVPRGTGPKLAQTGSTPSANRSLRLRMTMTDNGTLRVDSAIEIEGVAPPQKPVMGPYLYAIRRADGSLLDFGSFADPLVEHSYNDDQKHDERRSREGSFAISIPGVTRATVAAINLQIYDARNVTLPTVLTAAAFEDLSRRATALRAVAGQELARGNPGRRQ